MNGHSSLRGVDGTDDTRTAIAKLIKTYIDSGK